MRLLKLKSPTLALVFALVGQALLLACMFAQSHIPSTLNTILVVLFLPANRVANLFLSNSGAGGMVFILFLSFLTFLQMYFIILAGISLYRHFPRRKS
jgi:hypothetical protein